MLRLTVFIYSVFIWSYTIDLLSERGLLLTILSTLDILIVHQQLYQNKYSISYPARDACRVDCDGLLLQLFSSCFSLSHLHIHCLHCVWSSIHLETNLVFLSGHKFFQCWSLQTCCFHHGYCSLRTPCSSWSSSHLVTLTLCLLEQ